MIIKLNMGYGWKFVDGVDDVEYCSIDPNKEKVARDQFTILYDTHQDNVPTLPGFILVKAVRPNGESIGVVSGYEVYLLNDNGKTIERLN